MAHEDDQRRLNYTFVIDFLLSQQGKFLSHDDYLRIIALLRQNCCSEKPADLSPAPNAVSYSPEENEELQKGQPAPKERAPEPRPLSTGDSFLLCAISKAEANRPLPRRRESIKVLDLESMKSTIQVPLAANATSAGPTFGAERASAVGLNHFSSYLDLPTFSFSQESAASPAGKIKNPPSEWPAFAFSFQ